MRPQRARTRVVFLQHPREAHKAVGTARMAALCLEGAERAVGVDFSEVSHVRDALSDPARPAILLYPGEGARDLTFDPPTGSVTLVVIDGTWHQARRIVRKNPWLLALPQYALKPTHPSEYRIRREPRADYVSTIEAVAAALGALEGDTERFSGLLTPFRAMVDKQLEYVAHSTGGRRRRQRRHDSRGRPRLPEALRAAHVICGAGEANAWPHDRARGGPPYPHELVHWVAPRLTGGPPFEALLAPRFPLSISPSKHSKLDPAQLLNGQSFATFDRDFSQFCGPGDVLCTWGHYATGLVREQGGRLPAIQIDIRKVAGDVLRRRPGSAEELVQELGLAWEPCGQGRGGERLGTLLAITHFLLETGA